MVNYETKFLAGIEVDFYGLEANAPNSPIVFFIHGRGGNRRNGRKLCAELAGRGYIAISLDHRNHGDRCFDSAFNEGGVENYVSNSYGIYTGTAKDISHIIDFLPTLGISSPRIAVTGFSLGGHACFASLVLDPRIKVAIPVCGAGDRLMQLSIRSNNPKQFKSEISNALHTLFEKYDAIHHLEKLADRKILMIHGAEDQVVSPAVNQNLYEKLIKIHNNPSDLKISLYSGIGHQLTPTMWKEAINWLDQKL
ncbi:MAG: prolyl oligopeptidase family serine peptidase [Lentisphaeria bacterium]|nr:prolyl oligopeptidase family serine peptidase [Lentisphaeria bacterium]